MNEVLPQAFAAGVERIAAWADLLDSINIYPVADGDTGRNLFISLTPLLDFHQKKEITVHQLLLSARGNSGNIAARFFSSFYLIDSLSDLYDCANKGRSLARRAVNIPRPGTMLTLFDAFVEILEDHPNILDQSAADKIIRHLEKSVHDTCEILPKLKKAGVVDAGALGMYIFFEGFFHALLKTEKKCPPVTELFKDHLHIAPAFKEEAEAGYCVDFILEGKNLSKDTLINTLGNEESVIVIPEGNLYKIHLHTEDKETIKSRVARLGSMVNWQDDNLSLQINEFNHIRTDRRLHIMTDAAGSLTRADAQKNGITLLHSYITLGERSLPETYLNPAELYSAMQSGIKISTSQASVLERHQFYESVLNRFDKVLYLCVGSFYTGNYTACVNWKKEHDPQNRLIIIDTGAASGKLALIVRAVHRYLEKTKDMEKTVDFAARVLPACEEYIFLDKLEYLAAGGRLSRASAFIGDMLKMKPVVSPMPDGAKKVAVTRNQEDQMRMACEKLAAALAKDKKSLILLEYSNNYDLVNDTIKPLVKMNFPQAEIVVGPLSLTSGAHMGPGTWAVAFLPEI